MATEDFGSMLGLTVDDLGFATPTPQRVKKYTSPLAEKQAASPNVASPLGGKQRKEAARRSSLAPEELTLEQQMEKMEKKHTEEMKKKDDELRAVRLQFDESESELASTRAEADEALELKSCIDSFLGNFPMEQVHAGEREQALEYVLECVRLEKKNTEDAKAESEAWQNRFEDAKEELASHRKVTMKTMEGAEAAERKATKATAELAVMANNLKKAHVQIGELEKKMKSMSAVTEENAKLQAELKRIQQSVDHLNLVLRQEKSNSIDLQGQIRHLTSVKKSAENELQHVLSERRELAVRNSELEGELKEAQEKGEDLREQFVEASKANQELMSSLEERCEQYEVLKSERDAHQSESIQLKDEQTKLMQKHQDSQREGDGAITRNSYEMYEEVLAQDIPVSGWGQYINSQITDC